VPREKKRRRRVFHSSFELVGSVGSIGGIEVGSVSFSGVDVQREGEGEGEVCLGWGTTGCVVA